MDGRRSLSRLDEILLQADLITGTEGLKLPPFDGDGKFLAFHTIDGLIEELISQTDDYRNTLTARLLLLLESRPLIGSDMYADAIDAVVGAYWQDYPDHSQDFVPAFLTNDIQRLWRTLCVNYECRRRRDRSDDQAEAIAKKKNFSLKHSRLLTCYSAILFLLHRFSENGTVTPDDAIQTAKLSPTMRLEQIRQETSSPTVTPQVDDVMDRYRRFLEQSQDETLVDQFKDREKALQLRAQGEEFGKAVSELISVVGNNSRFHRLLIV